ncbi:VOC family protein [Kitasatospora sp. NPDC004240]
MITTDFVTGSPCWVDLGAPDVAAAGRYYRAVFGWDLEGPTPESGGYVLLRQDGGMVGGIGPLTEEGARSAWMIYFRTPDVAASAAAVEKAGGTVRVPPTDAEGEGLFAQCTDPQGGEFALWQPGRMKGFEVADRPGGLCWTELYTTDTEAARTFYAAVFGWQYEDMELPGGAGAYTIITPAGQPEERMHGGLLQLPPEALTLTDGRPYWHPVFAVADCDASAAAVTANGGSLQMGPEDVAGVGRLAVCVDPSGGADFVLLAPEEDAPAA